MTTTAREISLSQSMNELRQDYLFTKRGSRFRRRRTGMPSLGGGADYHLRIESDWLYGMEYIRAMDRDDVTIGSLLDLATTNTVGDTGFSVDPNTGDEALDEDLQARWNEETSDPDLFDVAGEMTFQDAERYAFRSKLLDGDILALLLGSGQVQMIEAHRCRTPHSRPKNTVCGVTLSGVRKANTYWICRDEIEPTYSVGASTVFDPVPTRDEDGNRQIVHVFNKHRFSLTRGVPALHRIVDTAGMFEDLNFAKLLQAQVVSAFGIIRERSIDSAGGTKNPFGAETTENRGDGTSRTVSAIEPGMEYEARLGEKITAFSPSVPNAEYFLHAKLLLTLISINVGIPYVMYMMDASETNFSGYRGAVNEARQGFRRNQQEFIRRFHRPIYRWKVRQWMENDPLLQAASLRSGIKIFEHTWNIPGWPYIEPLTDNQADLLQLRNGLTSPRRLQAKRGCEFKKIVRETLEDNSSAIEAAMKKAAEINARNPDAEPIHWRELLYMATPDGVTLALPAPPPPDSKPQKKEPASA